MFPRNKDWFISERTRIISKMLDNPDDMGIYPTTTAFAELDDLYDEMQSVGLMRGDISGAQKCRDDILKCRCCEGDGVTDRTLDGSFEDPIPDYLECGVCDGKGFVNKNGDYFLPEKACPICGSVDTDSRLDMRSMNPLGAGLIFIEEVVDYCNTCQSNGDFAGENDGRIEAAIQEAITKRSIESLDKLAEQGNTAAWIERCLGLEIGFLKRCRANNDFSRETYILLRFIECQPDLLTLAKLGYPPKTIPYNIGTEATFFGVGSDK